MYFSSSCCRCRHRGPGKPYSAYNCSNAHEEALIYQAKEGANDAYTAVSQVIFGTPADQQAEAKAKLVKETLPPQLAHFEKLLQRNGSNGYLVGSKLSYADLSLWVALQLLFSRVEGARARCWGPSPRCRSWSTWWSSVSGSPACWPVTFPPPSHRHYHQLRVSVCHLTPTNCKYLADVRRFSSR
jgi:glutathione S-transferase